MSDKRLIKQAVDRLKKELAELESQKKGSFTIEGSNGGQINIATGSSRQSNHFNGVRRNQYGGDIDKKIDTLKMLIKQYEDQL